MANNKALSDHPIFRYPRLIVIGLAVVWSTGVQLINYLGRGIPAQQAIMNWLIEMLSAWVLIEIAFRLTARLYNRLLDQLKESHRQQRQQAALVRLSADLAAVMNETEICHEVVRGLHELLGYDFLQFFLIDRNTGAQKMAASVGTLAGRVPEADEQKGADTPMPARSSFISKSAGKPGIAVSIPINVNDEAVGRLRIESRQPNRLTKGEREVLTAVANQAGIAIGRARLFAAERQRADELFALRDTLADILAQQELPGLLEAVLIRAIDLLEVTSGELGLYDENQGDLRIVACHHLGRDYRGTRLALGEGLVGQVALSRQPLIIPDYQTWEHRLSQYQGVSLRGVVAAPLMKSDQLVGVIAIGSSEPDRFYTEADLRLLNLFAQQAAIAVSNARLYQSQLKEAEKLAILYQVSKEIATSLEPEKVYRAIHKAASQLMPSEAFVIALLDATRDEIEAVYLIDRSGFTPPQRFPTNQGLSGQVIANGKPIRIDDAPENTGVQGIHYGDAEFVRSVLAVPMRLGDDVFGMLSAQSYEPRAYSAEDEQILSTLANHAAIAISNARLFEKVQYLAIQDDLTRLYNRRHFFNLAKREFERSTRYQRALSIIMFDVDRFKQINDRFGHIVGDQVLEAVARTCKKCLRRIDVLARYGGEEFIIMLPESDVQIAQQVAERVRVKIEGSVFQTDAGPCRTTISLGIATLTEGVTSLMALLKNADAAMYVAKESGRNRIHVF